MGYFINSEKRALAALVLSWAMFIFMAIYSYHEIRSTLIYSFGSKSQISSLQLEKANADYEKMIHHLDKAINEASPLDFVDSLHKFHSVKEAISTLAVTTSFHKNNVTKLETRALAKKVFNHFIQPFNQRIQTLHPNVAGGALKETIKRFIADYEEFHLIYQGPLDLGYFQPLKTSMETTTL